MTTPKQHWAEAVFEAFLELFGEVWPAFAPIIIVALLFVCITQGRCLFDKLSGE